jgi:hypothetical protein
MGAATAPRLQAVAADLERDGRIERVVFDPSCDPTLSVWRGGRRLWRGVPRRWHPWKLRIADVDGDGKREIVVGIRKATRFFPYPHHCLFIYAFDGATVAPKWLGSSLSKPFTDFAFARQRGSRAATLVALETTRDGRLCLMRYLWNGFGFTAVRQQGAWKRARLLEDGHGKVHVEADARRIALSGEIQ